MIDLKEKNVLIRTQEEYKKVLKAGREQGFHWSSGKSFESESYEDLPLPNILIFHRDKTVTYFSWLPIFEFSELSGTKELTAREFIKGMQKILKSCENVSCRECVLNKHNTKSKTGLCIPMQKMNSDDVEELIEIIKSGRTATKSQNKIVAETIQNFIKNPDRTALTDVFMDCLKFAVEKLKE